MSAESPRMNFSRRQPALGRIDHNVFLMNPVSQFLSAGDILLDVDALSKTRVFEEVGRLFEQRHGFAQAQVVENLSAREKLGSTGLGQGVAIPHARIKGLRQAVAA